MEKIWIRTGPNDTLEDVEVLDQPKKKKRSKNDQRAKRKRKSDPGKDSKNDS